MASTPGFEPGPHWWETSAPITAKPLLPLTPCTHAHLECTYKNYITQLKQSQRSYKSNIMTKTTNDATHTIIDGKPYNWRVQKLSCRVGNEHFHHRVEYL